MRYFMIALFLLSNSAWSCPNFFGPDYQCANSDASAGSEMFPLPYGAKNDFLSDQGGEKIQIDGKETMASGDFTVSASCKDNKIYFQTRFTSDGVEVVEVNTRERRSNLVFSVSDNLISVSGGLLYSHCRADAQNRCIGKAALLMQEVNWICRKKSCLLNLAW